MNGQALVTGAARGIGLACAKALHREGLRVYGADLDQPERPEDAALFAGFFIADLSREDQAVAVAAQVRQREDGLACLVNNAALQVTKPLAETGVAEFRAVLDVNLVAPFVLAVELLGHLKRAGGAVVNIASVHAVATSPAIGAYAASKGGLLALTRTMALEFAPLVRANAVLPGAVDTDMLRRGLTRDLYGEQGGADPCSQLAERHPLGRIGRPEDIAQTVVFLADPEKSAFVTGQGFVIDGGCLCKLSTE